MLNNLLGPVWAICPAHVGQSLEQFSAAIKAGPVDEAARDGVPVQKHGSLAVVNMRGPMIKRAGAWVHFGIAGTRETGEALKAAAADKDIESILWVIDSPGGSVDGLDELAAIVKEVKQIKPVIVQVDGLLASAALYVASAATAIYANRRDLIGSIGTRIMLYDYSEMFKNDGIKAIPVDTGEHKSAGAIGTEITDAQIAEFQRIADGYFNDFKNELAEGRDLPVEVINGIADGRLFFANEQPLDIGLIDDILTTQDTISKLITPRLSTATAAARLRLLDL